MNQNEKPKFEEALEEFMEFCESQNAPTPHYWLRRQATIAKNRLYSIYRPKEGREIGPHRELYELALKRKTNVSFELLGELDGLGVATVNSPSIDNPAHEDSGVLNYKIYTGEPIRFRGITNKYHWLLLKLMDRARNKPSFLTYY
jgi:hypothetical protein